MNFANFLFHLNVNIYILPLFVGLLRLDFHDSKLKLVIWYLCWTYFLSLLGAYVPVKSWFKLETNIFFTFTNILSATILKYLIFKKSLFANQNILLLTLVGISPIVLVSLLKFIGYNFLSLTIFQIFESIISILLSFFYLTNLYKRYDGEWLRKEPMFWISNAFLISGIVSFIFNTFANSFYEYSIETFQMFANFYLPILSIFCYLLVSLGIYLDRIKSL